MPFTKIARHGKVTVVDREGMLYLVYTVNNGGTGKKQRESTGHRREKKLQPAVVSRIEAINGAYMAAAATKTLKLMGMSNEAEKPKTGDVVFNDAIAEAISKSPGSDYYKKNLQGFAAHFEAYIKTQFPRRPYFSDLDVSHVIGFVQELQRKGVRGKPVSNKSLRAYISPILMASRYWTARDPKRYNRMDFDNRKYLPLKKKEFKHWTLAQVLKVEPLCRASKSNKAMPMLMLGALTGCNVKEMQCIQKKDWDTKTGVLSVRQAKNDNRPRKLPVVGKVRDWCDEVFPALDNPESYLITTDSGNPMPENDYKNTGRAFDKRVIQPAVEMWGDSYRIVPSDVRETFTGLMVDAKIDPDAQRAYTGHAGRDVHASNYADYSKPATLREHVTNALEQKYKSLRSQKGHSK